MMMTMVIMMMPIVTKIINGNNDDDNYMNLLWKSEIIESHSMLRIYSRKKYALEYGSEGSVARLAKVGGL